jgi:MFS transporter, DHA2 family, methylenomycin A resistance protein
VLTIAPAERSGMAASTVNTSRELGGVLAVAILGAVINGRLVSELNGKLGALGVGPELKQLVVHAVTHGGLPADATLAILTNPVVAANPGVIPKILDAAETAFGHALHSGLLVAAVILFAAAIASVVGTRKVVPAGA